MWLENGVLWLKTNSQPKLFQSCSFSSFYRGEEVCSRALRPQLSIQPQHALLWRARVQTSGSVPHLPGGPFVLGMPSPLALGPPATGLAQACPAQMLVVLVFLPSPPPLPVVAKLHQKKKKKKTPLLCLNCSISTIFQVEERHQAGSSRKTNLLTGFWVPMAYLGTPACAPKPRSHMQGYTAALGGCQHAGLHCSLPSQGQGLLSGFCCHHCPGC